MPRPDQTVPPDRLDELIALTAKWALLYAMNDQPAHFEGCTDLNFALTELREYRRGPV